MTSDEGLGATRREGLDAAAPTVAGDPINLWGDERGAEPNAHAGAAATDGADAAGRARGAADERRADLNRFARGGLLKFVGGIFNALFGFLLVIVITRG